MSNKKTFEDNLKELEEVATKLEAGNLGLDEAIEEFEKGMKLSKECTKKAEVRETQARNSREVPLQKETVQSESMKDNRDIPRV